MSSSGRPVGVSATEASYPSTFLDFLPDPPMGSRLYREALERSHRKDRAIVPPMHALLKVTGRCSSGCLYCDHSGNGIKDEDATTHMLEGVLKQIAALGTVSVNFTGGEPLLREDVAHLVRFSKHQGLYTILLTNGMGLASRAEELAAAGLDLLFVSVDSVRREDYAKTRGVPLSPVLEGIEEMRKLGPKGPRISVTAVISRYNLDSIEETIGYFNQRGIGVQLTPYHHHGPKRKDRISPRNRSEYEAVMERLARGKEAGAGILNSHAYLDHFVDFTFGCRALPHGYRCYCGYTTLYIDSLLNVRPCWSMGLPRAGNLKDQTLKDILASKRMEKARKRIRLLDCERCWLLCTAEISLRWK